MTRGRLDPPGASGPYAPLLELLPAAIDSFRLERHIEFACDVLQAVAECRVGVRDIRPDFAHRFHELTCELVSQDPGRVPITARQPVAAQLWICLSRIRNWVDHDARLKGYARAIQDWQESFRGDDAAPMHRQRFFAFLALHCPGNVEGPAGMHGLARLLLERLQEEIWADPERPEIPH